MEKIKHIVMVLVATLSLAACNVEIDEIVELKPEQEHSGKLVVSAIAGTVGNGDAVTKAHGDYGYDILWDENDKIAVVDALGHQGIFGITDGVGEKVGTFAQSDDDKYVYSGTVTGYYPAEMLQKDGSVKWPAVQTYSKVMTAVPMMSTATITDGGTVFKFDGLGGVFQLMLTVPEGNLPMKSITVSADNLDNPVSLDCTGLTLGAAAKTVNISLPAQEYTNMKLSFVASNGTQRDMTAKQAVTIKKNVVLKGAYALNGFELKTEADYLYFTAVDGSVSVGMRRSGTVETIGFEYTTDPASGSWEDFTADNSVSELEVQNMITLDAGETVFIRAKALRVGLNKSVSDYWRFVFSGDTNGRVQAGGNIMSLLDPEVKSTTVGSFAFCHLFDAAFDSRKLLISSPKILVTNLAPHCFDRMFYECRALQEPPMLLPATELAENCYEYMFSGCAALKYAPALPATKLAKSCYYGMFFHCSAITESPYLPATALADGCYQNMFDSCSSLSSVNVNFTNFNGATESWLSGVSSDGVFYCPQEVAPDFSRSSSTIPAGWKTFRNVLPDNADIGTEVYSSGRLGIYVGTLDGHKLLFAKTDVGSEDEYKPGARFSRDELDSPQSWGQGWRLPTEAEMEALYKNFKLDMFEDSAWFSFDKTSTSLLFPYTNNVADGKKESRCWLSGKERFFWFRSDLKHGSTGDTSEISDRRYTVRLVKDL